MNQLHQFIKQILATVLICALPSLKTIAQTVGQTVPYIDSLEQIIKKNAEDTNTVYALIDLSFYIIESNPSSSLKYSNDGLTLSEKLKWNEGIAWSLMQIALSYDYLANYDSAMIFYHKTFDKRSSMNDRNGMAGVLLNVAGSYHYRGIYSIALDYYLKALTLYKSTNNEKGITRCYNNLGNVSRVKKDYQAALNYYLEVKKIREKNKDEEGLMFVYNNISSLFAYIGNYQASIEYGQKSADIAIRLNKKVDLANALLNIGMGYLAFNNIPLAEKNLLESKKTIDLTQDKQYKAYIFSGLGELFLKKKNYSISIQYLDSAVTLADENQRTELLTKCYKILSACYEQMGLKDKSLEYYKKYNALNDTMLNQENLRQMNEMNAVYKITEVKKENTELFNDRNAETAKANKNMFQRNIFIGLTAFVIFISVSLLVVARKNIRISKELVSKNTIIEKTLHEKEVLLKEIHHRVKNNLQLVSSLLQLQINRTTDSSISAALLESQTRIESMAMIHKYLYGTENIGEINMKVYLEQLVDSIEKSYKKPGVEVERKANLEELGLNIDTAVPLGIIATELISNSFKYAFAENRRNILSIQFKRLGTMGYQLTLSDNGESADLKKIKSSSDSLGLKLVHLLAKQLRADLEIEHKNGLIITIKGEQLA